MVHLSPEFTPAHLTGMTIHPDNALKFDFLIHRGDTSLNDAQKREEYKKLVKYFLASLTIPDENQWVNLSPYEKDRIIKEDFGKTEMGRDLLAQDYILKQITASLIYPEERLGKKFWEKIYEQAWREFGSSNVPVNTFNKVWIVPDEAAVYESGNTVYVLRNHLKVMLEEDYLSLEKHHGIEDLNNKNTAHTLASKVVKEIVLPALEREVNEGKNFANLRQIYSAMILATWYKRALKESLLGKVYANQAKVKGVDQNPLNNKEIYKQYLKAFKKGVFNYIKEDVDKYTSEAIPRKYFSGGLEQHYARITQRFSSDHLPSPAMVGDLADEALHDDRASIALKTPQETIAASRAMTKNEAVGTLERRDSAMRTEVRKFMLGRKKAWLNEKHATLTDKVLKKFYQRTLVPLMEILGSDIDQTKWNLQTWQAFQEWGNRSRDSQFFQISNPEVSNVLDVLMARHPQANRDTLRMLLEADFMIDRIQSDLVAHLSPEERKSFSIIIHDYGYYLTELARTKNAKDQLLPVGPNGSLKDDGYLIVGEVKVDLLNAEARLRYDNRYAVPGSSSVVKLSLADFKLESETEKKSVLRYFTLNGKNIYVEDPNFDPNNTGKGISLEAAISEDEYKGFLSKWNVFNGFVQSWESLVKEAAEHFTVGTPAYDEQLAFLYSKQETALASMLLLVNIPKLFEQMLDVSSSKEREEFQNTMNHGIDALWRVKNPWVDWVNPLIQNAYAFIGHDQQLKITQISKPAVEEFRQRIARISSEFHKRLTSRMIVSFSPFESDNPTYESPEAFYKKKKQEGFNFVGVVTAAGLGIATEDRDRARKALLDIWKDLDREKTIIVCGGTGNQEIGNLSGVELVYEVAEEMGFKTMGIMSAKGFTHPIRQLHYLMVQGMDWGEESDLLYMMSDTMVAFTGGNQSNTEISKYMNLERNNPGRGNVILVTGIRSHKPNKAGSIKGSLDAIGVVDAVRSYPKGRVLNGANFNKAMVGDLAKEATYVDRATIALNTDKDDVRIGQGSDRAMYSKIGWRPSAADEAMVTPTSRIEVSKDGLYQVMSQQEIEREAKTFPGWIKTSIFSGGLTVNGGVYESYHGHTYENVIGMIQSNRYGQWTCVFGLIDHTTRQIRYEMLQEDGPSIPIHYSKLDTSQKKYFYSKRLKKGTIPEGMKSFDEWFREDSQFIRLNPPPSGSEAHLGLIMYGKLNDPNNKMRQMIDASAPDAIKNIDMEALQDLKMPDHGKSMGDLVTGLMNDESIGLDDYLTVAKLLNNMVRDNNVYLDSKEVNAAKKLMEILARQMHSGNSLRIYAVQLMILIEGYYNYLSIAPDDTECVFNGLGVPKEIHGILQTIVRAIESDGPYRVHIFKGEQISNTVVNAIFHGAIKPASDKYELNVSVLPAEGGIRVVLQDASKEDNQSDIIRSKDGLYQSLNAQELKQEEEGKNFDGRIHYVKGNKLTLITRGNHPVAIDYRNVVGIYSVGRLWCIGYIDKNGKVSFVADGARELLGFSELREEERVYFYSKRIKQGIARGKKSMLDWFDAQGSNVYPAKIRPLLEGLVGSNLDVGKYGLAVTVFKDVLKDSGNFYGSDEIQQQARNLVGILKNLRVQHDEEMDMARAVDEFVGDYYLYADIAPERDKDIVLDVDEQESPYRFVLSTLLTEDIRPLKPIIINEDWLKRKQHVVPHNSNEFVNGLVGVLRKGGLRFVSADQRRRYKLEIIESVEEPWYIKITVVEDKAMNSVGEKSDVGGIDFNSANLNLQIKRDGNGVPLPIGQQDMAQLSLIQGFIPQILEIKPVLNLPIVSQLQQKLQSAAKVS